MSLVICRECGHEVGSSASSCPHCGTPRPGLSVNEYQLYLAESAACNEARTHNYIGPAFAVLFLYPIFVLPGLVANILYLRDAVKMERIARQPLGGIGCLWTLLIMAPITACVYYVAFSVFHIAGDTIRSILEIF